MFLPSNGFISPELFQSNWAAGTSGKVFFALISQSIVLDDVTFIGSNGLNPKFAANFGAELHFSPYN